MSTLISFDTQKGDPRFWAAQADAGDFIVHVPNGGGRQAEETLSTIELARRVMDNVLDTALAIESSNFRGSLDPLGATSSCVEVEPIITTAGTAEVV